MTRTLIARSLATVLVFCILAVGGIASAQSITHESQHSHHQKADHGTVLCSWMCAAGQVLDSVAAPFHIERSPIALADQPAPQTIRLVSTPSVTSRGPPTYFTAHFDI